MRTEGRISRRIEGLAEIAEQFDAMLIDQFGVIHDGRQLYPGAARVLEELHALSIPVVIMTNSGRRSRISIDRTVKMGIPRAHFLDCVSSGEVAFHALDVDRAFVVGRDGDDYSMEGVTFVDNPKEAQVMLILGSNAPKTSLDDYAALFRGLTIPAICCNPDKLMISPSGLQPAPGAIADLYEKMGGAVRWIGKPYPEIYEYALKLLPEHARVLCIGDSPEHDVAGGKSAGLTTLLVQQGVSADVPDDRLDPQPDYIMREFVWTA
jgi:HAD superfamily hydrolase (TIGR01459 family)